MLGKKLGIIDGGLLLEEDGIKLGTVLDKYVGRSDNILLGPKDMLLLGREDFTRLGLFDGIVLGASDGREF